MGGVMGEKLKVADNGLFPCAVYNQDDPNMSMKEKAENCPLRRPDESGLREVLEEMRPALELAAEFWPEEKSGDDIFIWKRSSTIEGRDCGISLSMVRRLLAALSHEPTPAKYEYGEGTAKMRGPGDPRLSTPAVAEGEHTDASVEGARDALKWARSFIEGAIEQLPDLGPADSKFAGETLSKIDAALQADAGREGNKKHMVVGFAFDSTYRRVLLLRKTKPEWQAGRFNGVGGKIESGESSVSAMRREFREEVGLDIPKERWRHFCSLEGSDWRVEFFETTGQIGFAKAVEDEVPEVFSVSNLPWECIDNLHWLIPMAAAQFPVSGSMIEEDPAPTDAEGGRE
jgi:8-oxo-dGTP diphosphatase